MRPGSLDRCVTCVSPEGRFVFGIHKPSFYVENFRENDYITSLGEMPGGKTVENQVNFPAHAVEEPCADCIYEIPNAFPFKGTTYINSSWADPKAGKPDAVFIPRPEPCSLSRAFKIWLSSENHEDLRLDGLFSFLPRPILLSLADASTDSQELAALAGICCKFLFDDKGEPDGMMFKKGKAGKTVPDIKDHILFEVIANNPNLPDSYKRVMVLRPGIQGSSEITGEWLEDEGKSHVFEYLRRNSYIPWGHFAANTADDTVRYRACDLSLEDMRGMRHLYYQRTYARLARELDISMPPGNKMLSMVDLENLRLKIQGSISTLNHNDAPLVFNSSLWGWNFGFGYAQSGYRLHASHQQIHQQYAMIPAGTDAFEDEGTIPSYACGDMVADFVALYRKNTGKSFFENYVKAIRCNKRTDGRTHLPSKLEIFEDDNVLLFVPKAQTSQWEVQLMPLRTCGNILEADAAMRDSLDRAILLALHILEKMGAKMVSTIEYSRRFDADNKDQQLLYAFLPKLPESPGAFSEAQLRWINGHFPEDFAAACRSQYLS